jgi:hypothetical protein
MPGNEGANTNIIILFNTYFDEIHLLRKINFVGKLEKTLKLHYGCDIRICLLAFYM